MSVDSAVKLLTWTKCDVIRYVVQSPLANTVFGPLKNEHVRDGRLIFGGRLDKLRRQGFAKLGRFKMFPFAAPKTVVVSLSASAMTIFPDLRKASILDNMMLMRCYS